MLIRHTQMMTTDDTTALKENFQPLKILACARQEERGKEQRTGQLRWATQVLGACVNTCLEGVGRALVLDALKERLQRQELRKDAPDCPHVWEGREANPKKRV